LRDSSPQHAALSQDTAAVEGAIFEDGIDRHAHFTFGERLIASRR
jgi:hypothetical protein